RPGVPRRRAPALRTPGPTRVALLGAGRDPQRPAPDVRPRRRVALGRAGTAAPPAGVSWGGGYFARRNVLANASQNSNSDAIPAHAALIESAQAAPQWSQIHP